MENTKAGFIIFYFIFVGILILIAPLFSDSDLPVSPDDLSYTQTAPTIFDSAFIWNRFVIFGTLTSTNPYVAIIFGALTSAFAWIVIEMIRGN